jgi:hypothetical protein
VRFFDRIIQYVEGLPMPKHVHLTAFDDPERNRLSIIAWMGDKALAVGVTKQSLERGEAVLDSVIDTLVHPFIVDPDSLPKWYEGSPVMYTDLIVSWRG